MGTHPRDAHRKRNDMKNASEADKTGSLNGSEVTHLSEIILEQDWLCLCTENHAEDELLLKTINSGHGPGLNASTGRAPERNIDSRGVWKIHVCAPRRMKTGKGAVQSENQRSEAVMYAARQKLQASQQAREEFGRDRFAREQRKYLQKYAKDVDKL